MGPQWKRWGPSASEECDNAGLFRSIRRSRGQPDVARGARAPVVVSVTLDASDEDAAEARARLDVYREWTARGLRVRAGGALPDLAVTELGKVSSLRAPFADRGVSGFTFVPAA